MSSNWFTHGGASYASHRPNYPSALAEWLAEVTPTRGVAVDAGCGSGQLTVQLAQHFERVIGTDPSASQVVHAAPHANVSYLCAPAERLPLATGCADLITAAQAAHWFDMPAFCTEAARIARPGAVVALVTYGVLHVVDDEIDGIVQDFYHRVIGPWWPAERRHVETGYRELHFPFAALAAPRLAIERDWNLADLLGYIGTWSAIKAATQAGEGARLDAFARALHDAWGDPQHARRITWPLALRAGRL